MRSYIQNLFTSDDPNVIMQECQDWFSKGKKSRLEIREWVRSAYSCPLLAGNDFVPLLLLTNSCSKSGQEDELSFTYIDYAAEYLATRTNYNPLEAIESQKDDFTDKGIEIASVFLDSYTHHYQAAGRDLSRLPQLSLPSVQEPSEAFRRYMSGSEEEAPEGKDISREIDQESAQNKESKKKKGFLLPLLLLLLLLIVSAVTAMAIQAGKHKADKTDKGFNQSGTAENITLSEAPAPSDHTLEADSQTVESSPSESSKVENAPSDQQDAENPPADNQQAENPPADNQEAENPPADNQQAENPPVDNSQAESSPKESDPTESKAATAGVVCLDPRVIIRTGPGMNYPYVAEIDGQSNMQLEVGEVVKSQGNDGYEWRKINIDNYIGSNIEGFIVLKPDKLKKGTTYYIANQYLNN